MSWNWIWLSLASLAGCGCNGEWVQIHCDIIPIGWIEPNAPRIFNSIQFDIPVIVDHKYESPNVETKTNDESNIDRDES